MAFVRMLTMLCATRDRQIRRAHRAGRGAHLRHGGHVPPARHLLPVGQLYEPVDSDQVMYYREDKNGQILQEGINEAGAMSSWIAAAPPTPTTAGR
jgi:pyruvate dehydrogenase E1 component